MSQTFAQRLDYLEAWNADIFSRRRAGELDDLALVQELEEWQAAMSQLGADMDRQHEVDGLHRCYNAFCENYREVSHYANEL